MVVPKSKSYYSYIDLCRKTNKPILGINIKKSRLDKLNLKDPITLKKKHLLEFLREKVRINQLKNIYMMYLHLIRI